MVSVWTAGKPVGATGATFVVGDSIATKLAAINGWTVSKGAPDRALIDPSAVLNAIVPADLAALTQLQTLQFSLLLSGSQIDASQGTTIRAGVQSLFAGKTTTLANLGTLVAPYDSPSWLWRLSVGFPDPVGTADVTLAGLS